MQKIILCLIKKPQLIAVCKVLGLVSKLITAPFWRIVEQNINILNMNAYFDTLTAYLERPSKDASGFINREEYPFEMTSIVKDKVFEALVQPDQNIDNMPYNLHNYYFVVSINLSPVPLKNI